MEEPPEEPASPLGAVLSSQRAAAGLDPVPQVFTQTHG